MTKKLRVLICGDRNWSDGPLIGQVLDWLKPTVVIHGACRGADLLADAEAALRGIKRMPFPANWKAFGRAAGPVRNRQMLLEGKPDVVVAFHDYIRNSKGTADMLLRAEQADVSTMHVSHDLKKIEIETWALEFSARGPARRATREQS